MTVSSLSSMEPQELTRRDQALQPPHLFLAPEPPFPTKATAPTRLLAPAATVLSNSSVSLPALDILREKDNSIIFFLNAETCLLRSMTKFLAK